MAVEDEFREFVAARYAALVRTARLLSPDAASAEDLTQTALLTTFLHWRSLREPAAAESYCRTVLARQAMRAGRRRWRGERPSAVLPEPAMPNPYDAVDDTQLVRRALATLPTDQRVVLVLRYYAQLSEAEIAEILRCPPGTVKSRASRAIAALRDSGLLTITDVPMEASDG